MFPLIFFLAEQKFSLLSGHFGHLSKNILYTRPEQRAHTNKCEPFNFNVLFLFDLTLDFKNVTLSVKSRLKSQNLIMG